MEDAQELPAHIAMDRPGELLRNAVDVAGELRRVELTTFNDPRDGTPVVLAIGDQVQILDPGQFDRWRDVPAWRKGTANLTRIESFIDLVERFKGTHSAIFAVDDPQAPRLTAIFDYHESGPDHSAAAARRHKAEYAFPLSDEWQAWTKNNGQPMAMADFAAFLEDRIVDVIADAAPSSAAAKDFIKKTGGNIASPSKLIEIARGLQVNEASTLREARNLSTGEAEVVFQSEHLDASGQKLTLPNLFMICVPVFARSPSFYQILARFRYRKNGASIVFWYDLWRADLVFEQAFTEACELVKARTELPLFLGTPEH